jgi:hypothetical protein
MNFEKLLSPRMQKHCLPQHKDKHFKDAAREAMVQIELALKEKGLVDDKLFGQQLIDSLFTLGGKNQNAKLCVPFGEQLQDQAKALFKGVFAYYRNYLAHDGSKINETQASRILILASELLDLIDASSLSFADVGGIEGLVKVGPFADKEALGKLLGILDDLYLPDPDGAKFRDIAFNEGFIDIQFDAVFDLDLVIYEEFDHTPSLEEILALGLDNVPNMFGHTQLTSLGKKVKEEIDKT